MSTHFRKKLSKRFEKKKNSAIIERIFLYSFLITIFSCEVLFLIFTVILRILPKWSYHCPDTLQTYKPAPDQTAFQHPKGVFLAPPPMNMLIYSSVWMSWHQRNLPRIKFALSAEYPRMRFALDILFHHIFHDDRWLQG